MRDGTHGTRCRYYGFEVWPSRRGSHRNRGAAYRTGGTSRAKRDLERLLTGHPSGRGNGGPEITELDTGEDNVDAGSGGVI